MKRAEAVGGCGICGQPYYKYTKSDNKHFLNFKGHANSLKRAELDIITMGLVSFVDNIIAALKKEKYLVGLWLSRF